MNLLGHGWPSSSILDDLPSKPMAIPQKTVLVGTAIVVIEIAPFPLCMAVEAEF
jgi:hypothetical protein